MLKNNTLVRYGTRGRGETGGFDLIVRWRREILSARHLPETTKQTVSQLSDSEFALYLAGKLQRDKLRSEYAAGYGVLGWP